MAKQKPKKKAAPKGAELKLESKSEIKSKISNPGLEKSNRKKETMGKPHGVSDKVWKAHSAVAKKKKDWLHPTNKDGTTNYRTVKYTTQKRGK